MPAQRFWFVALRRRGSNFCTLDNVDVQAMGMTQRPCEAAAARRTQIVMRSVDNDDRQRSTLQARNALLTRISIRSSYVNRVDPEVAYTTCGTASYHIMDPSLRCGP